MDTIIRFTAFIPITIIKSRFIYNISRKYDNISCILITDGTEYKQIITFFVPELIPPIIIRSLHLPFDHESLSFILIIGRIIIIDNDSRQSYCKGESNLFYFSLYRVAIRTTISRRMKTVPHSNCALREVNMQKFCR